MCACTWWKACRAISPTMLNARQLDLAVLFDTDPARRWSVTPLLEEKLFLHPRAPAA